MEYICINNANTTQSYIKMSVTELYRNLSDFHGSIQVVTNRSGYSRETVRKVLQGKLINADIIVTAVRVLEELRAERDRQEGAAKAALESLKQ